jgi:hypothetical protein
MSIRRLLRILAAHIFLVGGVVLGSSALAQEPGSCDPNEDPYECECPSALQDFETCERLSESELLNPAQVEDYREAISLNAIHNANLGVTEIHSDFSTINGGGILPIHDNNGHWESIEELWNYMEVLTNSDLMERLCNGEKIPPQGPGFMTGKIFRWNQFEGVWAENQVQDPILAAISDADGNIWIDEEFAANVARVATGCQTETDVVFTATQCSFLYEEGIPVPSRELCPEFPTSNEWYTEEYEVSETRQEDFHFEDTFELGPATIDGLPEPEFRIGFVEFEYSRIVDTYYSSSGNEISDDYSPHPGEERGKPINKLSRGKPGVCGDGEAWLKEEKLFFKTSQGTAPNFYDCPDTL